MSRKHKLRETKGQGLTEYVLILALIALAALTALRYFGGTVNIMFGKAAQALQGKTYSGEKYDDLPDIDDATKSRDTSNWNVFDD